MPVEQAIFGQRSGEVLRGVEQHFNHAFDVAVGMNGARDVHTEAARNRRANLLPIEVFNC